MPRLVDTLVALMVLGILAGLVLHNRTGVNEADTEELARNEVRRFQRQIMLQAALEPSGTLKEQSFPETVDAAWFEKSPPSNPLFSSSRAWVEIASSEQRLMEHPPDIAVDRPEQAQFWYNPNLGIIRARVPSDVSDEISLELYNFVNGTNLTTLYPGPAETQD